jgi:hypothetical protein
MRTPLLIALALANLATGAHASPRQGESINGFPNWAERVLHEWTNRARCDPAVEMVQCGSNCGDGACYTPKPPLGWLYDLNRCARFHCDEMVAQNYFTHDSNCMLPANISALYPNSCSGAASCACTAQLPKTTWFQRVGLFGFSASSEVIVGTGDPSTGFYLWLYEPYPLTVCGYNQGPPTNSHRWNLLNMLGSMGAGANATRAVIDLTSTAPVPYKIASGSHYPRQAASVAVWANWYDTAGPLSARVFVDGTSYPMSLQRGTPQNGAWSATITGVGSGCHRYYFVFQDSTGATLTYPGTGSLGIGPANCADWDTSRPPFTQGVYCTAKTNSLGCVPSIGFTGTPSATGASPFTISATLALNQKLGLLFYGYSQMVTPFQGGWFCASTPVRRTLVQSSNGNALPANDCSGSYTIDFNSWIQNHTDLQLAVGQEFDAQYWSRDPASASTTGLTDAISFHVGP